MFRAVATVSIYGTSPNGPLTASDVAMYFGSVTFPAAAPGSWKPRPLLSAGDPIATPTVFTATQDLAFSTGDTRLFVALHYASEGCKRS
ncbi:hypothetical protein HYH03_001469 [Edaphochlamys debaryana]|uniref:Uncharacterized protein n=1 Tax=Edaphochlamys debaryana TaxID=47281 RepID=A0A835YN19_9CHLO|nr:hypothetical protein HYH03_001469 [Edaphochlamys debaryana]|eukprot:KAG2500704.1 hypothetical protein HYH03_001469 [Edaphochlamys debaryana]